MSVAIRPAVLDDFEHVAAILSSIKRELVTPAELTESNLQPQVGDAIGHKCVAEADNRIVGYATIFHVAWMKSGQFAIKIWVDPNRQHQGIGRQLYDAALADAQAHGGTNYTSDVLDNDPQSLRFAEKRGYAIERHLFDSKIDLRQFDMRPFEGVLEQVRSTGIRLFSLADAGNTKDNLGKLWAVNYATYKDDPGSTGTFPTFDEFYEMVSDAGWFNPYHQFLAADGDEYIGLAAIRFFPQKNTYYNMMTGVMPAYRGRKIALALKLMTITYAKSHDGLSISTDNDSQNAPMLAINRKLGYVPQVGVYRLVKMNNP